MKSYITPKLRASFAEAARWNQEAWEKRAEEARQENIGSRFLRWVAILPAHWRRVDRLTTREG